ncbi:zinc ribbon domain-containing protein, partial [Pseudomonas aeruginosa]|uniref:zinc ribbon domain-containing protein n=1 Tax=Pseudomonas aeruginosa TaxID=287 RepID=UPI003F58BBC2
MGKNIGWKQETNIGNVSNQIFVDIPHARFIDMLKYKWEKVGRTFETVEEAYTSKCSFLDKEEICYHDTYLGKRGPRGLFTTKE